MGDWFKNPFISKLILKFALCSILHTTTINMSCLYFIFDWLILVVKMHVNAWVRLNFWFVCKDLHDLKLFWAGFGSFISYYRRLFRSDVAFCSIKFFKLKSKKFKNIYTWQIRWRKNIDFFNEKNVTTKYIFNP